MLQLRCSKTTFLPVAVGMVREKHSPWAQEGRCWSRVMSPAVRCSLKAQEMLYYSMTRILAPRCTLLVRAVPYRSTPEGQEERCRQIP